MRLTPLETVCDSLTADSLHRWKHYRRVGDDHKQKAPNRNGKQLWPIGYTWCARVNQLHTLQFVLRAVAFARRRILESFVLLGPTFAYNCCRRLAHVMYATRIVSSKSGVTHLYDGCTEHEKYRGILKHVFRWLHGVLLMAWNAPLLFIKTNFLVLFSTSSLDTIGPASSTACS